MLKVIKDKVFNNKRNKYSLVECPCGYRWELRTCRIKKRKFCNKCRLSLGTKHGMCGSRPYRIWNNLKQRINNPNRRGYENYGGKGIGYDPLWEDFNNFWEDMKEGYADNLTIDRIDNNKGYSKLNCKWSSYKEQANNTSKNRVITFKGETLSVALWSNKTGIKSSTLRNRLFRQGWPVERALTQAVKKYETI